MRDLHLAYGKTDDEIRGILRALAGDFVPPGPAGSPERNPATLPTGRNLYFFDPEALPSKTSFELGVELADNFLDSWRKEHGGAWPDRVAFSLSTRGSMSDYGVAEAQILHLMGVRPVWRRGRVADLEVVPATELGRPRIDVFIETKHHYNDYLRSRAELLDRAVRLVCSLDEADNHVRENREQARRQLLADGLPTERAEVLSRARIFAVAEGRFGSGLHDGLFESTGVWESRADLAEVYMAQHDHVFTLGAWNEKAPEAYRRQLEGADAVLKTTSRHGAFTGRAHYSGGNLASTIEHLSGASPGYFLVDLRRVGDERIEEARFDDAPRDACDDLRSTLDRGDEEREPIRRRADGGTHGKGSGLEDQPGRRASMTRSSRRSPTSIYATRKTSAYTSSSTPRARPPSSRSRQRCSRRRARSSGRPTRPPSPNSPRLTPRPSQSTAS